ncbi:hypothetical protein EDB19DRAFT_1282978 [Suillus lakei]|nr:hypothetical protein EDB19DRAFT_1282978 [Suillus lakei]
MTSHIKGQTWVQVSSSNTLAPHHRESKVSKHSCVGTVSAISGLFKASGIVVMVKYCGYLVRNELLLQRAVELGHPRPVAVQDQTDIILLAARNLMGHTGVLRCTKLRRVKTPKGIKFWCIAFSSNDPCERLPATAPSEEKYKALKEALQKKGPPQWYQAP